MEIYAVKCRAEMDEVIYNELLMHLSEIEKDRISSFHKQCDANRALIGKIMMRSLLCKNLELKMGQLKIQRNDYGKPYVGGANIHFNISHSGIWIVCILDSKKVGIDIEEIVDIDIEEVSVFLSKQEREDLAHKSTADKRQYFFDLWSLKESYIKAIGRGLSIKLESFSICKNSKSIEIEGSEEKVYFKQYDLDPNYKLSVCTKNRNFPKEIQRLSLTDLAQLSMTVSNDN